MLLPRCTALLASSARTRLRSWSSDSRSSGSASFYAGTKIVAIGKNYAKHRVEMGGTAAKSEEPLFFLKPNSSYVYSGSGSAIVRPRACRELAHEVELGVVIGATARYAAAADWRAYVSGYVLALDMTARDIQAAAKKAGAPWTQSKCYDTFTPMSAIVPASRVPDPHDLELTLSVDGALRQRASTAEMQHLIPELIAYVSSIMTLEPGDVILTGTPDGVGSVAPGQLITATLGKGLASLSMRVVEEAPPAAAGGGAPPAKAKMA